MSPAIRPVVRPVVWPGLQPDRSRHRLTEIAGVLTRHQSLEGRRITPAGRGQQLRPGRRVHVVHTFTRSHVHTFTSGSAARGGDGTPSGGMQEASRGVRRQLVRPAGRKAQGRCCRGRGTTGQSRSRRRRCRRGRRRAHRGGLPIRRARRGWRSRTRCDPGPACAHRTARRWPDPGSRAARAACCRAGSDVPERAGVLVEDRFDTEDIGVPGLAGGEVCHGHGDV